MIDIVQAIINRLNGYYKNEVYYVAEKTDQDVTLPTFLISIIDESFDPIINDRANYNALVNIVYMASADRKDILKKSQEVQILLKEVFIDGKLIHGKEIKAVSSNAESLVITANYEILTDIYKDETIVEKLDVDKNIKE